MRDATRSTTARSREPTPAADRQLGSAIRSLRRERRLTLVQVASATGLSQPFLSQLELGRSRPSMRSLFRIADALGTTQQALLGLAAAGTVAAVDGAGVAPPAHDDDPGRGPTGGDAVGGAGTEGDGTGRRGSLAAAAGGGSGARLLYHGGADITEFVLTPAPYAEFYAHDRHEQLYVVRGVIELELAGDPPVVVRSRESIGYPGRTPHRFRQVGLETAVLLLVHSADPSGPAGAGEGSAGHGA